MENENPVTVAEILDPETTRERLEQMVLILANDREQLDRTLNDLRNLNARQAERLDSTVTQRDRANGLNRAVRVLLERDSAHLYRALNRLHAGEAMLDLEHPVFQAMLKVAIHAGIRHGYDSEAHRLATECDLPNAEEIWREVSSDLRQTDGTYPAQVTAEHAVGEAWEQYRWREDMLNSNRGYHPADPRLTLGWRHLYAVAKRAGMCDVFDTLASTLGVPDDVKPTYSGTVEVSGTWYATITLEGVSDSDPLANVDEEDVMHALRNGDGSIDIHDWDNTDLSPDED